MTEEQIAAVAQVLARWNPLGEAARNIEDLDGYRVEAADIIFGLKMPGNAAKPERFVMDVLNQAFDLTLTPRSCTAAAQEIVAILGKKVG